ncbi:hypothetical protein [Pseudomonas fluvialis]|jgi:type II secretory pathway component PulM|uniref:Uncharacterized protein n=1 Tax=Pseudomonas fluvialis TaxID=1793966 RepID=A0A2I0CNA5_9PSED|nr:hypothetical protein [Pseudomonas pharmacofabricae]MBP8262703.1 hypothetical protein [Pseudomonas sp.]PKF70625.1 hypothetical protein CW360_12525 [Pseudomonas pharmacofabricae]
MMQAGWLWTMAGLLLGVLLLLGLWGWRELQRIRQLEAKVERQAALLAQIDQVLDNPTLDAAEQRRQSEALMAHVLALREGR